MALFSSYPPRSLPGWFPQFHSLPMSSGGSCICTHPVSSLELLTTCPSSWWVCLDVPHRLLKHFKPQKKLIDFTPQTVSYPFTALNDSISTHPSLKTESQHSHLVIEFWQLVFNVFYVYLFFYLLSKIVPNSLLADLFYSILALQSIFYTAIRVTFYNAKLIIVGS